MCRVGARNVTPSSPAASHFASRCSSIGLDIQCLRLISIQTLSLNQIQPMHIHEEAVSMLHYNS